MAYPDLKVKKPVFLVADPVHVRSATRAAPGLPFEEYERFIVGQHQQGVLLSFAQTGTGRKTNPFLKVPGIEVLSLAFHPRYAENRFVFLHTLQEDPGTQVQTLRVLRYRVARDAPNACEPDSGTIVMEWESRGHAGGTVLFGPDGMLYISVGDGSAGDDREHSGQDLSDWNASILRIDVDREEEGRPYGIPPDNPFLPVAGARGEVWAFGLRNPWRMHFDPEGRLWVGDVGQDRYEAILIVEKGDNFGWSLSEGGAPYDREQPPGPGQIKQPALVHSHREARAIIGGVTYQGRLLPELHGAYLYADHISGTIWAARSNPDGSYQTRRICESGRMISSFSLDSKGEVYFLDYARSEICRLERTPPAPDTKTSFPVELSETGLFADVRRHEMAPGVIPYEINTEQWSDGAIQRRWIALPGRGQIDFFLDGSGRFPDGTVFIQSLGRPLRKQDAEQVAWVETRLLVLQEGRWAGYSYRWNDEGTDAHLVEREGDQTTFHLVDDAGGETEWDWNYPSRSQCVSCHTVAAGTVLGFNILQLNRKTGADQGNQLAALEALGLFAPEISFTPSSSSSKPLPEASQRRKSRGFPGESRRSFENQNSAERESPPPASKRDNGGRSTPGANRNGGDAPSTDRASRQTPEPKQGVAGRLPILPENLVKLVDPFDRDEPLDLRVRSYLHANCSHCHREAGGGNSKLRLVFLNPRQAMPNLGIPPEHGDLQLEGAQLVVPGDPERSILLERMRRRGGHQMPPFGSLLPDTAAVELFEEWINALQP